MIDNLLLIQRLRAGLLLTLVSIALFTAADLTFGRPGLEYGLLLKLLQVALIGGIYIAARDPRVEPHALPLALFTIAVLCITTVAQGVASGDLVTTGLLLLVMTFGAATLLPWTVRAQLAAVLMAMSAMVASAWIIRGQLFTLGKFPAIAVVLTLVISLFMTYELARFREQLDRELRQRQRDVAQRGERRFHAVIERSLDLISILDRNGCYRYLNPAHQAVFGSNLSDLIGRNAFQFLHPDDANVLAPVLAEGIESGMSVWNVEFRVKHKDGTWHSFEGTGLNLLSDPDVGGILITGRDITQRKVAEERAALLLAFAEDTRGTRDLDDLLARIQHRTSRVLPCDGVITFLWQASAQTFRAVGDFGLEDDSRQMIRSLAFSKDQPFGGRLSRGETVVINDLADAPQVLKRIMTQLGMSALVVAPLRSQDRHLGSLVVFRTIGGERFDEAQAQLCTAIGSQLAIAIEAAQLREQQQQDASLSAALALVGNELISSLNRTELVERLCRITTEVIGCDLSYTVLRPAQETTFRVIGACGVPSEDWEAMRILRLPPDALSGLIAVLGSSPTVEVETGRAPTPWAAMPARYGIRVVLYAPLRRDGEIVGLHAVGFRDSQRRFTELQKRIAHGVAELASGSLENARLMHELERASQLKSEFLATMSHELRSPLNIIAGYTDLLLEDAFGQLSPEQDDTLRRVQANARELLDLITATLDMSRLESGRLPLQYSRIGCAEVLDQIDVDTRGLQEQSGLTFVWNIAADLPDIDTDVVKLKVILKNLIGNAVKFTERGTITIAARRATRAVEIEVKDTGIGIAPEVLPIIFEPFRQGDSSSTRRHGGVGLGLYIVQRLLSLLGGSIAIESEPGRGSTFRITLPEARL